MVMTAEPIGSQRYHGRYPARAEDAGKVRDDVALALEAWGLGQLSFVAKQIATELFTNAMTHTDTLMIGVSVSRVGATSARLVVTDDSRALPVVNRAVGDECESGRGLLLVSMLADDLGSERVLGGKRVWADVSLKGERQKACSVTESWTQKVGGGKATEATQVRK